MKAQRLLFVVGALLATHTSIAANCPTGVQCPTAADACVDPRTNPARKPPSTDTPINFTEDNTEVLDNGDIRLRGNVEVRQGDRVVRADEVNYSDANQTVRVPGTVELSDPNLIVRGKGAKVDTGGAAEFNGAEFELPARAGHGSAEQIRLSANGSVDLDDVRYTTCPMPDPSWELKVGHLHIDQQAHVGSGTGTRVDFKGIPILYVPYISFPVGDEPKSGLLFPEFGQSPRSGSQLSVPYYWRIAPNYDATLTPTYFSTRGLDLGTEFRFLTDNSKGIANFNFLPDDRQTHTDRTFASFKDQTDFTSRLRLEAQGVNLGDNAWLEDFGVATYTSLVALPRDALLQYRGDEWFATAFAENFQIIDPFIARPDRPYTILPQIAFHGYFPDRLFGVTAALDSDFTQFQRNADLGPNSSVQRVTVAPEILLPLRNGGIYLEPTIGMRYLAYHLDDPALSDNTPSVIAPNLSVDAGMIFERQPASSSRIQTLEPRLLYAYVPYRNQDGLPVLDTAVPDFNLVELFETNRYVGEDRIGDINHVALGVTSRLIDTHDGRQILSATVGELYRFAPQRVALPGEIPENEGSSDIIGELSLNAYRFWSAHAGVQWDPAARRNERTELSFQFRPDEGKVLNVGYRFRRSDTLATVPVGSQSTPQELRQIDTSAVWPLGRSWNVYGRVIYSIKDGAAIDRFAGFEYRSCCWGVRILARRYVSTLTGESTSDYKAQLELIGLGNVAHPVDTFLAESIRGYSAARNDYRSTP